MVDRIRKPIPHAIKRLAPADADEWAGAGGVSIPPQYLNGIIFGKDYLSVKVFVYLNKVM